MNDLKKMFGNNIKTDCAYCDNFSKTDGCTLGKMIDAKGKCRKFSYNPTLRIPKSEPKMMQFSKEDFEL